MSDPFRSLVSTVGWAGRYDPLSRRPKANSLRVWKKSAVSVPKRFQSETPKSSHNLDVEPLAYQLALKDRALASAMEGITIADLRLPDNPLVYVNRGFTEITGYSREESIGRNCRYLQGPDTDPEIAQEIRRAIQERRGCVVELLNYRHDGTPFWNRLSLTPLRDASGQVTHYVGVQSDVTREHEAEQSLRQAKAELQTAHDRMQQDLQAAASIQRSLLPVKAPQIDGVSFEWQLEPCDELAGDTLNLVQLGEDHIAMIVLDVSGHGVQAALLSATLHRWLSPDPNHQILQATKSGQPRSAQEIIPPDEVARQLNHAFPMNTDTGQYFTLVYGVLCVSERQFQYVCAGHPAPIHLRATGEARQLATGGLPIGFLPDAHYHSHTVDLEPGDRIFLFSDGLPESENDEGHFFDIGGMVKAIEVSRARDLKAAIQTVFRDGRRWRNHRNPDDDLTLLGFEIS